MSFFWLFINFASLRARQFSESDSEQYLRKYGYFDGLGNKEKREAIFKLQTFFHLNQTGIVDDVTRAIMNQPRCGVSDVTIRRHGYFVSSGKKWNKNRITYSFINKGKDLPGHVVEATIRKAFDVWAAVTPLTFHKIDQGKADIQIGFFSGHHGDRFAFDNKRGGVLAHGFFPPDGQLHFDESEPWSVDGTPGTDLFEVAAHEIGHCLGLDHSNTNGALMWPSWVWYRPNWKLHYDDIVGIQSLYGPGKNGTPAPPVCSYSRDKDVRCRTWAKQGYCENGDYKKTMQHKCCNACHELSQCEDKHENCARWASMRGECQLKTWMRENCKKSCKFCS